ncbi:MAG: undecaprenyl/decaprenyl-phosphate alpha-N-acetylglucosaminyl 1-phosphate transferase [Gammaproteobacteria bacterium]|nr:undecaprenyl/decaprenyl-phosphate alpha-N-acetylglucosaminyl 1-phosphate transferase [Gammaproteobacteria bacterium]
MIAVYSAILALLLAIVLVPVLAHWAGIFGLLDKPGPRKIHHESVPRVGGIAIAVGALVAVAVWIPLRSVVAGYFVGAVIIFVSGLMDDRFNLDYRLKFVGQIAGALAFVFLGDFELTRVPFASHSVMPAWLGIPLTVVVLVGITNAINLSDGMDGLAGGMSLLAAGTLGYLAYIGGDKAAAILALCLVGAILGFLRYNTHPARVFMGDSGSQFLGFSVAALGLILIERSDTLVSPLVPVLVLGLPITDTAQVMIRRVLAGGSPFVPDRRHLHHRLLDVGLSQQGAVLIVYLLQGALVWIAWRLRYEHDAVVFAVFVLFVALLMTGIAFWEKSFAAGRIQSRRWTLVEPLVAYLRRSRLLSRLGFWGVLYGVSVLFIVVAVLAADVSADIGWLALLLFGMLLSTHLPQKLLSPLALERVATFTTSVLTIYLAESSGLGRIGDLAWFHGYLVLILLCIGLWLRFGGTRGFQLNALDLLIVLVVAILPNMPVVRESDLAPMVLESLLLFYACELILNESNDRRRVLRLSTLLALAILMVRAVAIAA